MCYSIGKHGTYVVHYEHFFTFVLSRINCTKRNEKGASPCTLPRFANGGQEKTKRRLHGERLYRCMTWCLV